MSDTNMDGYVWNPSLRSWVPDVSSAAAGPELKMHVAYGNPRHGSGTYNGGDGTAIGMNAGGNRWLAKRVSESGVWPDAETTVQLAPDVTNDFANTGGYKFTPTESGLVTVAVSVAVMFDGVGYVDLSAVVDIDCDIASDTYNYKTGYKYLGHRVKGWYSSMAGSVFIDLDEWDGTQQVGIAPLVANRHPTAAAQFAEWEWWAWWTPMAALS